MQEGEIAVITRLGDPSYRLEIFDWLTRIRTKNE
jgi:hypothetical protein